MSELTYTRCGDYYIPDLKLSEQPEAPIGKYGRMRQRYLKEHRPGLYSSLILSEKLYPHLLEIDRAARERYRHDTMCTDPKTAGDQWIPSFSKGNPDIPGVVYRNMRNLWDEGGRRTEPDAAPL